MQLFRGISCTIEPPNKGHFGDSINSAGLSIVERSSSSRRFSIFGNYKEGNIWGPEAVERSNIQCPFLGGSIIGGSTVYNFVGCCLPYIEAVDSI